MKKNGFTLMELLAAIALLGVLLAIAVTSVTKIKANSLEKLYQDNIDSIEAVAAIYDNSQIEDDDGVQGIPVGGISVQALYDEGLLEKIPEDPTGAGRILASSKIILIEDPDTLVKNYILVVDDNDNSPDENVIMMRGNESVFLSGETYVDPGAVAYSIASQNVDYSRTITCDAEVQVVSTGAYDIYFEEDETTEVYSFFVDTTPGVEGGDTEYIISGVHLCTIEYSATFNNESDDPDPIIRNVNIK